MDLKQLIILLTRKVLWYRAEAGFAEDPGAAAYYLAKAEAYDDALHFVKKAASVTAGK